MIKNGNTIPAATVKTIVILPGGTGTGEATEQITLLGVSFGGILAQCFMKKYPNKIQKLILAHTSTIIADCPKEELHHIKGMLNKNIKLINTFPIFVMRAIIKNKFRGLSKKIVGEENFWKDYFDELVKTY